MPSAAAADHPMIRLERLTKRYPGQDAAAVDELTLDVPRGEIVCLVGPSGCGKTTTMKLINRLIEPTSGRIYLDGEDVTEADPDQLRRTIGYAIQQTGLFPHRTVAENIATVPRLLGWDKARTTARVEELLDLVGLDPDTYRGRYPKQLSGGQQQRIGVARALAGDPAVMLMDEPFGAIDPLTREALQNEFLRIQSEIKKTIVFVTHDIDEAVKMGDRIAIFAGDGRVVQYDTPEKVLSEPVDDFVADFIGSGAFVKRLTLTRIGDIDPAADWPVVTASDDAEARLSVLAAAESGFAVVLDAERRPTGWLAASLNRGDDRLLGTGLPLLGPAGPDHTLFDALNGMLANSTDVAVVVDDDGRYRGTLTLAAIQTLIHAAPARTGAAGPGGGTAGRTPSEREVR
ncbi:osmoprotectant transport system ATP-binding protein [Murinocardiopsis flavida]|uniref:ABC-type quaternary amine transporter n=1 Tax=Murinocardiopsis flavida TaxID=645275 RepID=A0A2P8DQR6_9ACTN|nr:ABC transporter ATP-binding protein [Murinocardiopsis flavida]PSK99563.1 osmoprotectant transport system ATP-binding protein [Murinocardiopsis flavida]